MRDHLRLQSTGRLVCLFFVFVLVDVAPVCHYVNIHTMFESEAHNFVWRDTCLAPVSIGERVQLAFDALQGYLQHAR